MPFSLDIFLLQLEQQSPGQRAPWEPYLLADLLLFTPQLYESALTENQKLKTKLQEAQLELADIKSKLEKMAQVRGRKNKSRWGGRD